MNLVIGIIAFDVLVVAMVIHRVYVVAKKKTQKIFKCKIMIVFDCPFCKKESEALFLELCYSNFAGCVYSTVCQHCLNSCKQLIPPIVTYGIESLVKEHLNVICVN